MSRVPTKFVSLHNHTMFSPFDGLGLPDEHFKWCMDNGLNAHAITEHGNFNSLAHAELWVSDWNKSNKEKPFKYIPGIEAYFHPDLDEWRRDKDLADTAKVDKKAAKKLQTQQEKIQTKLIAKVDSDDEADEIVTSNALTIENEDETKTVSKFYNPVNRRHHLVLLPKNSKGLQELFHLTSRSFLEGFYRFPRIDLRMLKETITKGNVMASSACVGGLVSFNIFRKLQTKKFDELIPTLLDDKVMLEECVSAVGDAYEMMTDTFGPENYYLELQFNKLGAQDITNRAILEFAARNGLNDRLTVTCDAHYYNPNVWKERELYKKLGFMNYKEYNPDSLPKSKDDLKCELYPKNAEQVWDEYLRSKERCAFYDDAADSVIFDAIERTHRLAFEEIGDVKPDKSPKFPTRLLVPEGEKSFNHLVGLCKEGLKKRGFDGDSRYIERMKEELLVIKQMKNADYFISYQKIMELSRNVVLCGAGRGSGGGSLVNYVLYITDLDPIRWELPFSRFLSVFRQGAPDIDSDLSDRDKVLDELRKFFGFTNVVPISNYNTFKVKSLLKDVSKFYGIPFDEVNVATRSVERNVRKATMKEGDDKNLFVLTYEEALLYDAPFKEFIDKYPVVGESMQVLFKQNRSLGRHAGGVLICDDLPMKMPLIASKGEPQSPFVEGVNFKHLEKIGNYIKYDLLGLETLRLIERAIELIIIKERETRGWFELELEDGSKRCFFGDEEIETSNRGKIKVSEIQASDDLLFS